MKTEPTALSYLDHLSESLSAPIYFSQFLKNINNSSTLVTELCFCREEIFSQPHLFIYVNFKNR